MLRGVCSQAFMGCAVGAAQAFCAELASVTPRRAQHRHAPTPKNQMGEFGFDGHAFRRGRRSLRRRERRFPLSTRERAYAVSSARTAAQVPCGTRPLVSARKAGLGSCAQNARCSARRRRRNLLEPLAVERQRSARDDPAGRRALTCYFALHCMLHIRSPGAQPHALFLGFGAAGAAAAGVSAAAALPPPDFLGATPPPPAGR